MSILENLPSLKADVIASKRPAHGCWIEEKSHGKETPYQRIVEAVVYS